MTNKPSLLTRREAKLMALSIFLAICGSLGLDIHLASLPHIMADMHTNKAHMQQSVTFFILGVGASILVYGPLSDKFGRKPIVIFGLTIACISSYCAALTDSIGMFLGLRLLQGIGSGVCWGLGRIIAADVMQGERLAAVGSYFTLFLSLSPMLAPALGGYIQHWFDWQANFIVLGTVILLVILIFIIYFEETNEHKKAQAFSLNYLFKTYVSFFLYRQFVGCLVLTGIAMASNITYVTISSFIFQQEFSVSPVTYGWLMAVSGVASIVGKLISPWFILRLKNQKSLRLGVGLLCLAAALLLLFNFFHAISIPVVLSAVSTAILGLIFIGSVTMSMALSPFHDKRGSAGALFASFQLLFAFAISTSAAHLPQAGTHVLMGTYSFLALAALACYYTLIKNR